MFTEKFLEAVLLRPLSTPLDLCRTLNLSPTRVQEELLTDISVASGPLDWRAAEGGEVAKAAAMLVLWRVLRRAGARATILCPGEVEDHGRTRTARSGEAGRYVMRFLTSVCTLHDPALASCTRATAWNRLEFGTEPGWEIRLVPPLHTIAAEVGPKTDVALVLDAGNSDPAFCDAVRALEGNMSQPDALLVRVW